jgi:hypothetical protein
MVFAACSLMFFPAAVRTQASSLSVARRVRALTGAPTRVVWCQVLDRTGKSRLMGLDTEDGRGIRVILPAVSSCVKPLITPNGQQIVFSNRTADKVYVVKWDGSQLKSLVSGYAADVWQDPASHKEWVYVRVGSGLRKNAIVRYRMDDPSVSELVWDKTPVGQDAVSWFQVSRDGTHAGSAFPWPKCGVAILPNRSWKLLGLGCWTSLAPDNSYRFFHFDGTHKEIVMYDGDGSNKRILPLSNAPGVDNRMVLNPRWTNSAQFMTMDAPNQNADNAADEKNSEIYLGRFNSHFTRVSKWVRITTNDVPDVWASAWVKLSDHHSAHSRSLRAQRPAHKLVPGVQVAAR